MVYPREFIAPREIPHARLPLLQHLVDTYASGRGAPHRGILQ